MRHKRTTIAPPSATSNVAATLSVLAASAKWHYRKSSDSWLGAAAVLLGAREIAAHGDWEPFLRDAGIPARTASRMLDFARADIQIGHLAVLTRSEIAALIAQAGIYWPGPPRDWEFASAYVQAVVEIAAEHGYNAGELARYVLEFPAQPIQGAR